MRSFGKSSRFALAFALLSIVFLTAESCDFLGDGTASSEARFDVSLVLKNTCLASGTGEYENTVVRAEFNSMGTQGPRGTDSFPLFSLPFGKNRTLEVEMIGAVSMIDGQEKPSGAPPNIEISVILSHNKAIPSYGIEPGNELIGHLTIPIKTYKRGATLTLSRSIDEIDASDGVMHCLMESQS